MVGDADMNKNQRPRQQVIDLMRRLGLGDRIAEAQQELPDPVDLYRDAAVLARLGLGVDETVNMLGGSAW
jgi:hypothetical protein